MESLKEKNNNKKCIILCGRQNKKAINNIKKIIDFLNADLFLVYENDICNYSSHKNLKDKIKVQNILNKSKIDNQFLKIKEGWLLMEKYEKKNNFKYNYVFRLRCDIDYKLNESIDLKIDKNYVYLNSDFLFYGFRNDVKNSFFLYDFWYEIKNNNKLYNIEIIDMINTLKNNPSECFNCKKWKYLNKIKAIPIPILKNSKKTNYSKDDVLIILENLNKIYKNYIDVLKNKDYKLYFYNEKDKVNKFPCELSILLVLLSKHIIPVNSTFIKIIKKL